MSNQFHLIKIPVCSKKFFYSELDKKTKNSKYYFRGIVYYFFDEKNNEIIWEKMKILNENFSYRPNDPNMQKPTDFYKKNGKEREKIFPTVQFNNKIMSGDKVIMNNLNQHSFKFLNTILSVEGFISGSNSSGSDQNTLDSPILIFDYENKNEHNGLRFINASKSIRNLKKYKQTVKFFKTKYKISNFDDLEEKYPKHEDINFLIKKSNMFKNNFYRINCLIDKKSSEKTANETIDLWTNNLKTLEDDKDKDFLLFQKDMIKEKSFTARSRSKFSTNLWIEAKNLGIYEYIEKENNDNNDYSGLLECSHIYSVDDAKKNKKWKYISDYNNGVLLPPTTHVALDKKHFYFNEDGSVHYLRPPENSIKVGKLKQQTLNSERLFYIKERKNL